ncbi:hypothetical protein MASR2M15_08740 [Anaerolineales bacterium]
MGRLKLFLLMTLLITVSACNLGTPPASQQPLLTATLVEPGKPTVSIQSPKNGEELVVKTQTLISILAQDAIGVTRVHLFANDQIVKSASSQDPKGDKQLSAVMDYTPLAAGVVDLKVIAYRGTTASEPATVQVNIRSSVNQVTATSLPNSNIPVIPNDGVCRAMTNVNLNLRSGPSTGYNVITVLTAGTLSPIIGRLGDNTWWQINANGILGWVSSQYTIEYGSCFNVPIINIATLTPTKPLVLSPTTAPTLTQQVINTPIPGKPDMVVTSISGAQAVTVGQTYTYTITITNTGFGPTGQFENSVEFDGSTLDLGVVSNLNPGQSVALQISLPYPSAGNYTIKVIVEPLNKIVEISEVNNTGLLSVTAN